MLIGLLSIPAGMAVAADTVPVPPGAVRATAAPVESAAGDSDAPGEIAEWFLHFDATLDSLSGPTYAELLLAIPADTPVTVLLAASSHESVFRDVLGLPAERLTRFTFLTAAEGVSSWARDRYLFLERHEQLTLVLPAPDVVPGGRRGDIAFARAVAERTPETRVLETELAFEGGDVLLGEGVALVGINTIVQNEIRLKVGAASVLAEFALALGRKVSVVGPFAGGVPHDHLDMYAHLLEDGRVMVGDARMTLAVWETMRERPADQSALEALGWPREEDQQSRVELYDGVARDLEEQGFVVVRVPALHGPVGDALFTWTNAVSETRGGKRHAYVPRYRIPTLDAMAHGVWQRLGYTVHPIEARSAALEGGAVRCLTNERRVLRPAVSAPPAESAVASPRAARPLPAVRPN
ncbi:MAG: agmatine deiminase family protein [Planctomycetota bacterium]|nr:agmatine deiminase family protein [Planctomycetota bacterium]